MFERNLTLQKPYFMGVAIATLLTGAFIFAIGIIEQLMNVIADWDFSRAAFWIIGGLIVISLGYIHLELEMIRVTMKS